MSQTTRDLFLLTQCSWCNHFYTTELFLCPNRKLQSNCPNIKTITKIERDIQIVKETWLNHAEGMFRQLQQNGILTRCRDIRCLAVNPNPQKKTCWQCGQDTLSCPVCSSGPILRYNPEQNIWVCPNNSCNREFPAINIRPVTTCYPSDPEPEHNLLIITIVIILVILFLVMIIAVFGNQIRNML